MTIAAWKKLFLAAMTAFFVAYVTILAAGIKPLADYGDVIELVGMGFDLCAFVAGMCLMRRGRRLPWAFFLLTALFLLIGEGLWSYYDHVLGIEPETPSLCDLFYVSSTLFCIAGITAHVRREGIAGLAGFSADFAISLVAAAGLIYIFLIFPALKDSSEMTGALLLQISYPVFDFGLFFGSMVIFFGAGREGYSRSSLPLMLAAFALIFGVDQLNLYFELHELDYVWLIEPLWPFAYCLLGLACLLSAEEDGRQEGIVRIVSPRREMAVEILRMLVPYLITFSALAFVLVRYKLYNFVFVWAMFLVVILSVRQFCVLLSNRRLNRELRKLNLKAVHEAQTDALTKLANRRHIDDLLAHFSEEDSEQPLGMLFIDVDLFKQVNDTFGHEAGDRALRGVAEAISDSLRDSDIGGRFGGDEFIALLPGANPQAVRVVGERIRSRVKADDDLAALRITLSLGGASVPPGGDVNALLKAADEALYEAKNGGRDKLVVAGA